MTATSALQQSAPGLETITITLNNKTIKLSSIKQPWLRSLLLSLGITYEWSFLMLTIMLAAVMAQAPLVSGVRRMR